jgi:peptide/nickel transport system substrate-binding protein
MLGSPPRRSAVLAALVAAGCGGSAPDPPPKLLRAAVRADVTGFFPNPPAANESYSFEMNRWVLDAVVGLDRGLNVVPALAAHWLTPDERTFVLELRPGLRFSDGRAVTATDAARSLEAGKQLAWPNDGYLSTIESVRVLDERRLEVRAVRPDPTLLARLAWGFVLPGDATAARPVPVVGTAPYTLEQWTPGERFSFARNPHHWGPASAFERAEFRIVPDDETRLRLVETGEADLADFVPPEAWRGSSSRSTCVSSWERACACCFSACASTARRSTTRACARPWTWPSTGTPCSSACSSARAPSPIS